MKTGINFKAWWPDVTNLDDARKAVRLGMWAAVFVSLVTALLAAYAVGKGKPVAGFVDSTAFLDAAIFAALAVGIHKESRLAAVAALVVFAVEKFYQFTVAPASSNVIVAIIVILCFTAAVRGAYALRRLRAANKGSGK